MPGENWTNEAKLVGITALMVTSFRPEWDALVAAHGNGKVAHYVPDLLRSFAFDTNRTVDALIKSGRKAIAKQLPAQSKKAEAIRLLQEGVPVAEIAKRIGVSRTDAHKMLLTPKSSE
jgi:Homeodomain-like domain